jgi:hypothetical protein
VGEQGSLVPDPEGLEPPRRFLQAVPEERFQIEGELLGGGETGGHPPAKPRKVAPEKDPHRFRFLAPGPEEEGKSLLVGQRPVRTV